MNFIVNQWEIIVVVIICLGAGIYLITLPNGKQKEVLLYWVIEAEEALGSGTGEVKLRYVYDLFLSRFPILSKIITFKVFSYWVDDALERMEELLRDNDNLREIVNKS